jgi:hypothetical protein
MYKAIPVQSKYIKNNQNSSTPMQAVLFLGFARSYNIISESIGTPE